MGCSVDVVDVEHLLLEGAEGGRGGSEWWMGLVEVVDLVVVVPRLAVLVVVFFEVVEVVFLVVVVVFLVVVAARTAALVVAFLVVEGRLVLVLRLCGLLALRRSCFGQVLALEAFLLFFRGAYEAVRGSETRSAVRARHR